VAGVDDLAVVGVGLDEGDVVAGGVEDELWPPDVADGLTEGAAAEPESLKPFARIARPPTTNATITRTLPVLRFTRASYPRLGLPRRPGATGALQGDPEALRGPPLAAQRPQAAEPAHQHRVVREPRRAVDGTVQQLVVSRGRETERLADRTVLGDPQSPRGPLEIQDSPLERIKGVRGRCR